MSWIKVFGISSALISAYEQDILSQAEVEVEGWAWSTIYKYVMNITLDMM